MLARLVLPPGVSSFEVMFSFIVAQWVGWFFVGRMTCRKKLNCRKICPFVRRRRSKLPQKIKRVSLAQKNSGKKMSLFSHHLTNTSKHFTTTPARLNEESCRSRSRRPRMGDFSQRGHRNHQRPYPFLFVSVYFHPRPLH